MKPKEQNIMKNKKGGVGVPSSVASWRVGPWESTKVMPSWTDTKTVGVCEKGGEAAVFVPLSTQVSSNDLISQLLPGLPILSTPLFWALFIRFPFLFYSKCYTISEVISATSSLP